MVFQQDVFRGDAPPFEQEGLWVVRVVQNIGKKHRIEGCVFIRNCLSVESFHGNKGLFADQEVDSTDRQVASFRANQGGQESIATSHIENSGTIRRKLAKPRR